MSLPVGDKFFQQDDSGPVSWLVGLRQDNQVIILLF